MYPDKTYEDLLRYLDKYQEDSKSINKLQIALPTSREGIEWLRGEYIERIRIHSPAYISQVISLVEYYLKTILPPDYDETR